MTPHNYLRQAVPYIKDNIHKWDVTPQYVNSAMQILDEATKAVKFVLPDDGVIFDNQLRGLPEIIKLPYEQIVIEYYCTTPGGRAVTHFGQENTIATRKRIVYAEQSGENIVVAAIVFSETPKGNYWQVLPYSAEMIPKNHVLPWEIMNNDPQKDELYKQKNPGAYKVEPVLGRYYDIGGMAKKLHGEEWDEHAHYNMGDEVQAVLSLIEALGCSNVKSTKLATRQKMNKNAAKRGALPFDEYHVLTLDGPSKSSGDGKSFMDRRSPREHLRRGHIRRLENKRIWINSMVVNAGNHGKIYKSYELEAA